MLTVLTDEQLPTERSEEVDNINLEIRTFCLELAMTMRMNNGIGIAAPQVGRLQRIIVIDSIAFESDGHFPIIMINPVIKETEGQQTVNEACLSFPGKKRRVKRAKRVLVEYSNTQGERVELWLHKLAAQVVLHELDHLEGITFLQKGEGHKL